MRKLLLTALVLAFASLASASADDAGPPAAPAKTAHPEGAKKPATARAKKAGKPARKDAGEKAAAKDAPKPTEEKAAKPCEPVKPCPID